MFSVPMRILHASIKSAIGFSLFALRALLNKAAMTIMNVEAVGNVCPRSRDKTVTLTMLTMFTAGTTRVKDRSISPGRAR